MMLDKDLNALPPTSTQVQGQPLDAEFAEKLRERLLMIAADERLRSMHTHLDGEIRRFSTIIEIAAKCLGRPLSSTPSNHTEESKP